ncbi:MAG: hypothetical protein ACYDCL_10285 [Myxococcales bacterium]
MRQEARIGVHLVRRSWPREAPSLETAPASRPHSGRAPGTLGSGTTHALAGVLDFGWVDAPALPRPGWLASSTSPPIFQSPPRAPPSAHPANLPILRI